MSAQAPLDDDLPDRLDLIDAHQAANIAGINVHTIYDHVHKGTIPTPYRVGWGKGTLVWERHTIEQWHRTRPTRGQTTKRYPISPLNPAEPT